MCNCRMGFGENLGPAGFGWSHAKLGVTVGARETSADDLLSGVHTGYFRNNLIRKIT